ncbi:hypothetical protein L2E82_51075 [Cichorium intybus]|nr:hypothetical protein L2E82_51075 [Cichorium intybus]
MGSGRDAEEFEGDGFELGGGVEGESRDGGGGAWAGAAAIPKILYFFNGGPQRQLCLHHLKLLSFIILKSLKLNKKKGEFRDKKLSLTKQPRKHEADRQEINNE